MKAFLRGFGYAFNGIRIATKGRNMRVHLVATFVVIGLGLYVQLPSTQWAIIAICIGSVLAAETANTAIEELCDFVMPERHPAIGRIKDLAAGAVLVLAIASAIVAALIFKPYIL